MPTDQEKFEQAKQAAQSAIDKFNEEYKDKPFGIAGGAASNALNEFTKANTAFRDGDTMGGSAAVLRGIGGLAGALLVFGGPAGAAVGAVLGAIMGVITLILESLKSASNSLVSQLKTLIVEAALRQAYNTLVGAKDTWELVEIKIEGLIAEHKPGGYTWKELDALINWDTHYQNITTALSTLETNAGQGTKEWVHLFDATISYAARFWLYIEIINVSLIAKDNDQTFPKERIKVADALRKAILNVHYHSVNEVDYFATDLYSTRYAYSGGTGRLGYNTNYIYHSVGIAKGVGMSIPSGLDSINYKSLNFAVTAGGTILNVLDTPSTLAYGRLGGEFLNVDPDIFSPPRSNRNDPAYRVTQVCIGELPNEQVVVACLLGYIGDGGQQRIAFCSFNDASDKTAPFAWVPRSNRWGTWQTLGISGLTILSLAIQVHLPYWGMYAFAVDASGNGGLYEVRIEEGNFFAKTRLVGVNIDKQTLAEKTYGVAPAPNRWELSPVTVSCVGETLYVQVGHEIHVRDNGNWVLWPMRDASFLSDENILIFQARAFADSSMVLSTDKGMYLRYRDPNVNWAWTDHVDDKISTLWFWKGVSRQANTARELLTLVMAVKK